MCNFFSCIVKKNGEVVWDSAIDNHSELVELGKIQDDTADTAKMKFARVEITPPDGDVFSPLEKWILKIDETITPDWFKKRHEDVAWSALKECLKEVLIYQKKIKELNKKRCWIKNSEIESIEGGTVESIEGGTVKSIRGGTVESIWGGTVKSIWGGTVKSIKGGTVKYIKGGTVESIWGGTVKGIRGGTVKSIWGGTVESIEGGTVTIYNNCLPKKMSGNYIIINKSGENPIILTGNKNIKIEYTEV